MSENKRIFTTTWTEAEGQNGEQSSVTSKIVKIESILDVVLDELYASSICDILQKFPNDGIVKKKITEEILKEGVITRTDKGVYEVGTYSALYTCSIVGIYDDYDYAFPDERWDEEGNLECIIKRALFDVLTTCTQTSSTINRLVNAIIGIDGYMKIDTTKYVVEMCDSNKFYDKIRAITSDAMIALYTLTQIAEKYKGIITIEIIDVVVEDIEDVAECVVKNVPVKNDPIIKIYFLLKRKKKVIEQLDRNKITYNIKDQEKHVITQNGRVCEIHFIKNNIDKYVTPIKNQHQDSFHATCVTNQTKFIFVDKFMLKLK